MPQLAFDTYLPQLFWLIVTFGVLYWIMARLVIPRIGDVLEERRHRIQHDLDEAERLKNESEKALSDYDAAIAKARDEAHHVVTEMREELSAELEKRRVEVDGQIVAKTEQAESEIKAATEAAMAELSATANDTAAVIVERLAGLRPAAAALDDAVKTAMASE